MLNITQIPSSRVPITEDKNALISREWYRFLYNLFILNGAGGAPTYTNPPTTVVVSSGSPFLYTNVATYTVDVMVSGGGVSKLEFSRDGVVFYDTGSYYGMFTLSPSDMLRVTYTQAPILTLIPR
jgi:hypothetical protein